MKPRALLLRGGRAGPGGQRTDVLVRDGRVAAVEEAGSVDASDAEVFSLPDTTVLPGMTDGHVHVDQWVHQSRRIDVSAARSAAEVAATLRTHLGAGRERRDRRVITGHGFVDGLWEEAVHKSFLDAEFGDLPVAVVSGDLHAAWLSSAALAVVGRDGHPTGVLREQDCMETLQQVMAAEPVEVVDAWVGEALESAAAHGVTGLVDFEYADNLTVWLRRAARAHPAVRIEASVWLPWLDEAIAAARRTGQVLDGTGGRVQVGPFKLMADGSLNTRTAHCHDPYPTGDPGERYGLELIAPDDLVALMVRASEAGLEPAVHAIGDAANSAVLDAFEKVGCRGRIEHAQLVRAADLPRFAAAGVVASVQPQHAVADRDVADRHWQGRTGLAFPYRGLHEAGVALRLGSDAPVSELNPWLAVAAAVARTGDARPPWHPEQALPLEVALAAACGGRTGIDVGAVADLTVAAGDVGAMNPDELREVRVLTTVVGGRVTHRAG